MLKNKKPSEDKVIDKPVIPFAIEIHGPLRETQIAKLVKMLSETVSKFLIDDTNIKKYTQITSERQELNKAKQYAQENNKLREENEKLKAIIEVTLEATEEDSKREPLPEITEENKDELKTAPAVNKE